MSRLNEVLKDIKVMALDLGIPEVAKRSGMKEDTLRRFLKEQPTSVQNFFALEAVVEARLKPTPVTDAAEIGEKS